MPTRKSSSVSPGPQRLYHHGSTPLYNPAIEGKRSSTIILPGDGLTPQRRRASSVGAHAGPVGNAFVADITPTYCFEAAIRNVQPVNDRIVWSADMDGTLRIRSLPNGTELKQLRGREDSYCTSLLYVEEAQKMWAGFDDGCVRVYDVPSATLEVEVKKHQGAVHALLSMEGFVYTGGADWKVLKWDGATGELVHTLHGHKGAVKALTGYNGPTGAVLFSGGDDGLVLAWDPYHTSESDQDAILHTFTGHDRSVTALETIPHVNQLWSGGEDTSVRVWDLATLECLAVLPGHTAPISSFLTVESRVWSGDKHGHVLLWDINTLTFLQDLSTRTHGVPLGMISVMRKTQPCTSWRVWTAGSSGVVQCWNADTVPIVFDVQKQPAGASRAPNSNAGVSPPRKARQGSAAPGQPAPAEAQAPATTTGPAALDGDDVASAYAELEEYSRSLEEQLADLRTQSEMGYERNRVEMQKELQTQQLLQEENERLRAALAEAGLAADDLGSQPRRMVTGPAAVDPVKTDTDDALQTLRDQLDEANRAMEALRQEKEQLETMPATAQPVPRAAPQVSSSRSGAGALVVPADGSVPATTGSHTRRFDGDNWEYLINEKPHELYDIFQTEAATALGVPTSQLTHIRFASGSLLATLDVQRPACVAADEVDRRLQAYPFSRLEDLHAQAFTAPKKDLDQAETELLEANMELNELHDEVMALRKELGKATTPPEPPAKSSVSSVGPSERETAMDEVKRLRAQHRAATSEVDHLRDENDRLLKLIDEHEKTLKSSNNLAPASKSRGAQAANATGSQQGAVDDLEALRQELRQELDAQHEAQEYLQEVAQQREDTIHDLEQELQDAQAENASLKQENERLRAQAGEVTTPTNEQHIGSSSVPTSMSRSIPVDATPPPSLPPRSPGAGHDEPADGEDAEAFRQRNAELEDALDAMQEELQDVKAKLATAATATAPSASSRSATPPWNGVSPPPGPLSDDELDSRAGDQQGELRKLREETDSQRQRIADLEEELDALRNKEQSEQALVPETAPTVVSEITSIAPSVAASRTHQDVLQQKNYTLQRDNEVLQNTNADLQDQIDELQRQLKEAIQAAAAPAAEPLSPSASATPRRGAPALVTTHHEKTLDGDEWEMVVQDSPEELRRALVDDLAAAVGVPNKQLTNLTWTIASLHVAFDVAHPEDVSEEDAQRAVDKARCDSAKDLYRKRQQRHRDIEKAAKEQEKAAAKAAEQAEKLKQLQDEVAKLKQEARAAPAAGDATAAPGSPAAGAPTRSVEELAASSMTPEDAEDYDALQTYVRDGLKPLVSRLKRRCGEREMDIADLKSENEQLKECAKKQAEEIEELQQKVELLKANSPDSQAGQLDAMAASHEKGVGDLKGALAEADTQGLQDDNAKLRQLNDTLQREIVELKAQIAAAEGPARLPIDKDGSEGEQMSRSVEAPHECLAAHVGEDNAETSDGPASVEEEHADDASPAVEAAASAVDTSRDVGDVQSEKSSPSVADRDDEEADKPSVHEVDAGEQSAEVEDESHDDEVHSQDEDRKSPSELSEPREADPHAHGAEDTYSEKDPRDSGHPAHAEHGMASGLEAVHSDEEGMAPEEAPSVVPCDASDADEDTAHAQPPTQEALAIPLSEAQDDSTVGVPPLATDEVASPSDPVDETLPVSAEAPSTHDGPASSEKPDVDEGEDVDNESWVPIHASEPASRSDSPIVRTEEAAVPHLVDEDTLKRMHQDPDALYNYLQHNVKPRLAQLQQQQPISQDHQHTKDEIETLQAALEALDHAFEDAEADPETRKQNVSDAVTAVCDAMKALDAPTVRLLSESPGGRGTVPTFLDAHGGDDGSMEAAPRAAPDSHRSEPADAEKASPSWSRTDDAPQPADAAQPSAPAHPDSTSPSPGVVSPMPDQALQGASHTGEHGEAADTSDLLERLRRAEALIERLQRMLQVSTEELDTQVRANNGILGEIQEYSESCRNTPLPRR